MKGKGWNGKEFKDAL
jgi:hypothetical protein